MNGPTSPIAFRRAPRRAVVRGGRAFTLVEMIVVMAIVVILVTLGLPAVQRLWENQRRVDTINLIQGMLTAARAKALEGGETETGLFFFLDKDGVQHVASIRRADPSQINARLDAEGYPVPARPQDLHYIDYRRTLSNVFEVTEERTYTIPSPLRVVPRYVVDDSDFLVDPPPEWELFSPAELANDVFDVLGPEFDSNQRHRNYFTIVFEPNGEVRPHRDVLIFDIDSLIEDEVRGDITEMAVGFDAKKNEPTVDSYYNQDPREKKIEDLPMKLPFLVYDPETPETAVNFPSVDGLLVYDDSLFREYSDPKNKRDFMLRTAQPIYINRLTGALVEGPVGENPQ